MGFIENEAFAQNAKQFQRPLKHTKITPISVALKKTKRLFKVYAW